MRRLKRPGISSTRISTSGRHTSGSHDVSCEEYHIPDHVQEHIDYVTPGVRMRPSTKKNAKRAPGREANHPRPDITKLPGLPQINSTTCSNYVVAECARGSFLCFIFPSCLRRSCLPRVENMSR